ncbi:hypothetical protein MMC13_005067 [Lambiella insularis]|nr:hypothetical protein [Lambiella insularis]
MPPAAQAQTMQFRLLVTPPDSNTQTRSGPSQAASDAPQQGNDPIQTQNQPPVPAVQAPNAGNQTPTTQAQKQSVVKVIDKPVRHGDQRISVTTTQVQSTSAKPQMMSQGVVEDVGEGREDGVGMGGGESV